MKKVQMNIKKRIFWKTSTLIVCLLIVTVLTGCFSNYGRVKRNTEITQAFEANQVPPNYKYYYYGRNTMPYIIIGIDPSYNLKSRLWQEVQSDTKQFKKMTYWVWTDYYWSPDSPLGAEILDPNGNKIGIWYSGVRWAAVKMKDDQGNIMIAPDTPWERGSH